MPSGAWCATRSARTRTARVRSPAIRTRRARERTRTSFASPRDARTAVFSPGATLTPTLSPVLVAGAQAVEGRAGALRRVDEGARGAVPALPRDLREGTRGPRGGGEGGEEVRGVPVRQRQPRDGRDARAGGGAFASPRGRRPRRHPRRPRARRPRARRRRAERQAPPRPRRRRERTQAQAPRGRAAVLQPDVPAPRVHVRLLALVAGRLGGGAVPSVLLSPGGFPIAPASLSHAYKLRDSLF